jgi:hypothetical protein
MDEGRGEVPTRNPPRVHTPERLVVGIGPPKAEARVESRYSQTVRMEWLAFSCHDATPGSCGRP